MNHIFNTWEILNQTKFHYEVSGERYNNNVKAFRRASELKQNMKFCVDFDFIMNPSKYKWHIEPPNSISYYMQLRAKDIADRYNKITLWYSGGTDSHSIAKAFTDLQIPVHFIFWQCEDYGKNYINQWETIVKHDFIKFFNDVNKNKTLCTFEKGFQTLPSEKTFEKILGEGNLTGNINVYSSLWSIPSHYDYTNSINKKDNDCSIAGLEKPGLRIVNNWWHHSLMDKRLTTFVPDPNTNVLWFFLSDEVPELHIKITWLRIKAMENIAKREKFILNDRVVCRMQDPKNKYFREINEKSGYFAISDQLSRPGNTIHCDPIMYDTMGFIVGKESTKAGLTLFPKCIEYLKTYESIDAIATPLIPIKPVEFVEFK